MRAADGPDVAVDTVKRRTMAAHLVAKRETFQRQRTRWRTVVAGIIVAAVLSVVAVAVAIFLGGNRPPASDADGAVSPEELYRRRLFAELQPTRLANCDLERFGEPNDGGYLLCANLLDAVGVGYSYGISGYDGWGCEVSRRLDVTVHQYDCFDSRRPRCRRGKTVFHDECVAGERSVEEGRVFDTVQSQMARNGDEGKHVVLKIDVESAEWDTFLHMPAEVLNRIDQIAVEFHGVDEFNHLLVVRRLKRFFHVVHLHFNNFSCVDGQAPFPAWAYEVLFVSKKVAQEDRNLWQASKALLFRLMPGTFGKVDLPNRLDAPNNPKAADCQPGPASLRR